MGGVAGRHRSGDWKQARGHLHAASGESSLVRDPGLCTLCLQCLHVCPTEAISEADGGLVVADKKCWRCGRCERVCPEGAIQLEKRGEDEFQMALAEATQAVLTTFEPGKVLYFNFVLEVQPECDCMPMADTPLVQDQGILAATDIVAVEQAALDLINNGVPLPESLAEDRGVKTGQRILAESLGVDGQLHVNAAARIGVGSREYEVIKV
ncbi:MAG: 4Fe-4S binding protein, partial [Chloroflexi bacterium]|nr:4Fe-4S binding protein [Chloroflexota bacterium]